MISLHDPLRGSLILAVLLGGMAAAQAQERLRPGLWLGTMSVNGHAVAPSEPQCISAEAAKTANGSDAEVTAAIDAENARNGCTTEGLVIDGPRIAFSSVCQGMKMRMDLTYRGTSSSGTMTTAMPGGQTRVMDVSNQRTGDCQ